MPRLSNDQLVELCAKPYESLTPGQRRSARTFKRRQINDEALTLEAERVLEDQPQMSVTKAYYAVMQLTANKAIAKNTPTPATPAAPPVTPPTTKEEYMKAIGLAPHAPAAAKPTDIEGMRILPDGWPADIETVPRIKEGRWDKPARILKTHPGTVGVVADQLTWEQATSLRRRIRRGALKPFTPKGSYRCEITPDHEHEGRYTAIAAYEDSRA